MAYLVCAHIFFVMHLWSFLHVMFSSSNKNIPEEYRLTESEHESLLQLPEESQQSILLEHYVQQRNIKIWTRNRANHVRYCIECQQIKPDRAHHCSTCGVCILKMDHHCPWVNNCVGFANQKSFLLTLFYGSLCFILCVVSELQFVVMDIHRVVYDLPLYFMLSGYRRFKRLFTILSKIHMNYRFIVITLLGFCMGFLYFQHVDLLLKNVTIIEDVQTVTFVHDRLTFDLGPGLNCTDVLGEWIFEWLFPTISATGDGTTFEVRYK